MSYDTIFIYENKMKQINKGYNFFTFYPTNFNEKKET